MMNLQLRAASQEDQALVARALYAAWQWRHPWDEASFTRHHRAHLPDSYVDGFGLRAGDAGVIAEWAVGSTTNFAGAAWYRFFSASTRRSGYVADDVPEVVLAVESAARRRGVGRRLLQALVDEARRRGVPALSLHVSAQNLVAARLYDDMGFTSISAEDGRGVVMIKTLAP